MVSPAVVCMRRKRDGDLFKLQTRLDQDFLSLYSWVPIIEFEICVTCPVHAVVPSSRCKCRGDSAERRQSMDPTAGTTSRVSDQAAGISSVIFWWIKMPWLFFALLHRMGHWRLSHRLQDFVCADNTRPVGFIRWAF